MKNSIIQPLAGIGGLRFVLLVQCLCTSWFLQPNPVAAAGVSADALAAVVADEKALPTVRLDALRELFSKHFKPQGTLVETADFFKHCHWIKKEDWGVVGAIAGRWPFEDTGVFSATPGRTELVAIRMKVTGIDVPNLVWLGFPMEDNITKSEIEMILSGKCPARLSNIHLLDGRFVYANMKD